MDSRRSRQRVGDAHHADQPRISNSTVGRPQRFRDFQRQYDLKPARCQRMTVSGFTIVNAYTQVHWRGSGVLVNYDAVRCAMAEIKLRYSVRGIRWR